MHQTGTQNEGSGFFIQEPIEDAAVCPVGSFPSDNDEWQLEDPPSNSPIGDSSSRIGNNDLATDNQKKSDQQTPVIVNCWGPVFWKGVRFSYYSCLCLHLAFKLCKVCHWP